MIEVAAFGFSFLKIAELVNCSEDIRIHVYLHDSEYEFYKSEIPENCNWIYPVGSNVRHPTNLIKGKFWKRHQISADLYLLGDDAPLFAFPKRGSKTVFLPIGFDLTVQPFQKLMLKRSTNYRQKCKRFLIATTQRSRIRAVDQIWASPFPVFEDSLRNIRKDIVLKNFVPFPINYKAHNLIYGTKSPFTKFNTLQNKFLVFFPGRLMLTKSEEDLVTGQTKGVEEAIRGFLKFQANTNCDAKLLLIDNSLSPDKEKVIELIRSLGAESSIEWIRSPSQGDRLTNAEMAFLYRDCDVVLGDFGAGWFGQTALEAAAHGKPFITHVDSNFMYSQFKFNPFLIAKTPDEICSQLTKLQDSTIVQINYSNEMRRWYENYLSERIVREWFVEKIREATKLN